MDNDEATNPGEQTLDTAILAEVATYYGAALKRFGPTSRGVDWKDDSSHRLRHSQFLRLLAGHENASVLDLGCGYGDFLPFIRAVGHKGLYVGTDIAPEMINQARRLHGDGADRQWHVGAEPSGVYDYAIASGLFNVRRGVDTATWRGYVESIVNLLSRHGRKGFGFNMLSLSSDEDKRRSDLYYEDPVAMLARCLERYGRHVALLQDYGLWEFTILVRHDSHTAKPIPAAP